MQVHSRALMVLGLAAALVLGQACTGTQPSQATPTDAPDEIAAGSPSVLGLFARCGGEFGLCGYEDKDGNERIPKIYEQADVFSEGLAMVQLEGHQGYINPDGKISIPLKFDLAGQFHNGMAEVVVGDKAGIINRQGNFVLRPGFARAIPLTDKVAIVQSGVFPKSRGRLGRPGDFRFELQGAAGLYNLQRGPRTAEAYKFSPFDKANHFIWAQTAGPDTLIGLMTMEGTWQVAPRFTMTETLNDERAVVKAHVPGGNGREEIWGAVDGKGDLVVPLKFAYLSYWRKGFTMGRVQTPQGIRSGIVGKDGHNRPTVKTGNKWFVIHPDGKLSEIPPEPKIIPMTYKTHADIEPRGNCGGGVKFLPNNGSWGLRKADGTVLIAPRYEAIVCYQSGVTWVPNETKHAWCPLGRDGQPLTRLDCQPAVYAERWSDSMPECLDADPFRNSVLWTRKYLAHAVDPKQPQAQWISTWSRSGCRTPEFQMVKPLKRENGRPADGGAAFEEARRLKSMERKDHPIYVGGNWTYPDVERMRENYPERTKNDEVEGTVTIDCSLKSVGRVTGCDILRETPQGYGFGAATVKLFVRYAKVSLATVGGPLHDGDRKKFTYKWQLD